MLLERTLNGEVLSDNSSYKYNNFDNTSMGVLDTRPRTSASDPRLLAAMLSDRSRRASYSHTPQSNPPYPTLYNTATSNNLYSPYPSQEPDQGMYMMSQSPCSSPESTNGKSMALPTCVVAPSAAAVDRHSSTEDPLGYIPSRKQREFIPETSKDNNYWEKRRKNNEAARRSREKRRFHDMALEKRIMDLSRDNCQLRNELVIVKKKYGLPLDEVFDDPNVSSSVTPVMTTMPSLSNAQSSPAVNSADLQQKYAAMPQSPVRGRNMSGTMYSPYSSSYHSANPPHHYPSSSPPSPPYMSRGDHDQDLKAYSGKYDAHNSHSMKSMKDQTQPMRVDDQVRPVYSSAFPPNMAPPYPSTLPVSSRRSYWTTATDMTSSDSNDEGEWNDPVQDQPLSLVKKRPSTENESGSELSNNSSRASYSPPTSSPATALPHKLRHKLSQDYPSTTVPGADIPVYANGLAQLSELALAHSNLPLSSTDDYGLQNSGDSFKIRSRSYSNPRSMYDTKYVERRKKNNEAARKCRENRKTITKIREVKSGYLENENGKLRDELSTLQEEMRELRGLLDKKKKDHDAKSDPEGKETAGDASDVAVKHEHEAVEVDTSDE